MKVHKTPEAKKMTREEWIVTVMKATAADIPTMGERPTGYRDGGATVRLAVTTPSGEHELDFEWRKEQPADAAAQILEYARQHGA